MLIKSQSYPQRCEICHQQDKFNARTNQCRRCKDIIAQRALAKEFRELKRSAVNLGFKVGAGIGVVAGLLAGIINVYLQIIVKFHLRLIAIPGAIIFALAMIIGSTIPVVIISSAIGFYLGVMIMIAQEIYQFINRVVTVGLRRKNKLRLLK